MGLVMCRAEACALPAWRDGIDESFCVGHQPMHPPGFMEHPTTGELLLVEDPVTTDVQCWECGAKPPASLALVDTDMMAGELWCSACLMSNGVSRKVYTHKVRIDDGGYNY